MSDIHFRCEPELFEAFGELTVFAVRVAGMRAALEGGKAAGVLQKAIAGCSVDPEKVAEDPMVAAWREAYGRMGVKPSKFRSSVEALLRRASKKAELELPIASVNLYNACSIALHAALGAYDADKLPGRTIVLRRAQPESDHFNPLGADASAFPLNPKLVVYASGNQVLCWGFNARDSQVSALDENSDTGLFFAEAAFAAQQKPAEAALHMLAAHLAGWGARCGPVARADRSVPEFHF